MTPTARPGTSLPIAVFALAALVFALLLLRHLAYPLFWNDEAETAMYAERVLDYGYPKVHGDKNVVYEFDGPMALAVRRNSDAYIGTTWGHYYVGALGVWLARGVDDVYAKTLRVRLPFALAGWLGVVLLAASVRRAFPENGNGLAALALLLCGLSISLVLHLREARYYPLLVLGAGVVVALYLRQAVYRRGRFATYLVFESLGLVALFNIFYPAYVAFSLGLIWDALAEWHRSTRREPWGALARRLSPIAISLVAVVPLMIFYDTLRLSSAVLAGFEFGINQYGLHWVSLLLHFGQYEWLIPAAVAKAGLALRVPGTLGDPDLRRRVSRALTRICIVYAALAARNPLFFERYFVVLSPLLVLIFLLDASRLLDRAAADSEQRKKVAFGLVASVIVALALRGDALQGRFQELMQPMRGPLDFAIRHIQDTYPAPDQLVIATNYESTAFMYYLGSRVVVGFTGNNLPADLRSLPDVVIPRKTRPQHLARVEGFLQRGRYQRVVLPVRELPYNNIPSLSIGSDAPVTHLFTTPLPERAGHGFEIFRRVRP